MDYDPNPMSPAWDPDPDPLQSQASAQQRYTVYNTRVLYTKCCIIHYTVYNTPPSVYNPASGSELYMYNNFVHILIEF